MAPLRVRTLVVDDSALMRAVISRMLRADPLIDVVGVARNGREAVERAVELDPDVVTLDIEMPEMDGLTTLRELMKRRIGKVVMLSAKDDDDTVYAALAGGAVDFVPKPSGPISADIDQLTDVITQKVRTAAAVDQDKVLAAAEAAPKQAAVPKPATATREGPLERVVGIGASTGGPPALEAILGSIAGELPACFLLVQHLPDGFSQGLCRRLSKSSPYPVRLAQSGERLASGLVYLAPAGSHMEVARRANLGLVVSLVDGPPVHGVRPAADLLFSSLAEVMGDRSIGVVLTGMGQDGAIGMAAIKKAGGSTIAQDEATAVVFGMPKAAIRTGAVDKVVPLGRVSMEIAKAVKKKMRRKAGASSEGGPA